MVLFVDNGHGDGGEGAKFSPTMAGTGKSDDLDSLINKSLGHFRIVERIGVGGMAMVFKAYQPTLDRHVAIKILPASQSQDPVFVKRFVQEARSVAKLAHPNIVQIHDFGRNLMRILHIL